MMTEDDRRDWKLAKNAVDMSLEPRDTRQSETYNRPLNLQSVCGFDCSASFGKKGSQITIWNTKYGLSYSKYFNQDKRDDGRSVFGS